MKTKSFLILLIIFKMVFALPAKADISIDKQNKAVQQFLKPYKTPDPDLLKIPAILRQNIFVGLTREQYISQILSIIRQNRKNPNSLQQSDVNLIEKIRKENAITQQIVQIISYDLNHDGVVTKEEIRQKFQEANDQQSPNQNIDPFQKDRQDAQMESQIKQMMQFDINADGKISYAEMATINQDNGNYANDNQTSQMKDALSLDPNKDGKITIDELEVIARNAFKIIDTDQNSILSADEILPLQKLRSSNFPVSESCRLRNIPPAARVIYLDIYEAQALSSISISGPDEMTLTADLNIEKSDKPIYLIISTMRPVIWRFLGQTDKISKVVFVSGKNEEGKIKAGGIGIPTDKVSYLDNIKCANWLFGNNDDIENVKNSIAVMTQRSDSIVEKRYGVQAITIANQSIFFNFIAAPAAAPSKFDPSTWNSFTRFIHGGIVRLKESDIVSQVKPQEYQILPGMAGISQLIGSGALIPVEYITQYAIKTQNEGTDIIIQGGGGNDTIVGSHVKKMQVPSILKIAKKIPYLPNITEGIAPFQFILGKGIPLPKSSGNVCIISEETKKPLSGCQRQ